MAENGVNAQGFVTRFLIQGPFLSEPETALRDKNQLTFEKKLRAEIAAGPDIMPEGGVTAGQGSPAWRPAQTGNDWFADVSTFYHLLTRVELKAFTRLVSDRAREVRFICWTYTAADIWINGERALVSTPAVYKPIKRQEFTARLNEGANEVFIRMRSLGARDTRTLMGLQIPENRGISVSLPGTEKAFETMNWLKALRFEGGRIVSGSCPPCEMQVGGESWTEGAEFTPSSADETITVRSDEGYVRRFDIYERMQPCGFSKDTDFAARAERLFTENYRTAYPFPVIMRYRSGKNTPEDEAELNGFLKIIESREDCSDFYLNALFRLFINFKLPAELTERFRRAVLDYRYWMDEDGADGMCFWSENHALLFYSNQYIAGGMYPDATFARSGLKGYEVRARGRQRCEQWLSAVGTFGFEEFASSSYAVITSCALLSIIDFGEAELAEKASKVLDALIKQMALHVFDGCVIAPQGRAYRAVLYPARQSTTALMNLCLPGMRDMGTPWLGAFAMSAYRIPEGLAETASSDRDMCYLCGNAEIHVRKTADYMLTSCASPRTLGRGWSRINETPDFDNNWIRTLNERFHGTTLMRPGAYGYQQHLMYAALSAGCASFVNHPGGASDASQLRPGYWNGNGIMPALMQKGSRLGIIYDIPETHPMSFTHVFWPACSFDETFMRGGTLFGRVKDGYMALWTSGEFTEFEDWLVSCEYRVYGRNTAYVYTMGRSAEYGSFEGFIEAVRKQPPAFDGKTLTCADIRMEFRAEFDESQIVD